MREIKAYLRKDKVDKVILALRENGVMHLTINHVRSLGGGVDPRHERVSFEAGTTYTEVAKLEFVCTAAEAEQLVPIIRTQAFTGERGDGVIFTSAVDQAVKVRTGEAGRAALR